MGFSGGFPAGARNWRRNADQSTQKPTMNQNLPAPAPAHSEDGAALLQRALSLHQSGDLNEAQHLYARILRLQPDNVDALYLDGMIAVQRGQVPHAMQRLQAALSVNPRVPAIHVALGNVQRDQGCFELADASYQCALALDPNNADAHYNLGIACHERGDLSLAISAYRRAVSANPAHPESWNNLGVALKASGKDQEAAECYEKVIGLQPQHALALFNLGVLHADAGRFEQAIGCYRRALQAQPAYVDAAFNLGVACKCLGASEEAAQWFCHALQLQPQHAGALQNLAATRYEQGSFDEAEQLYRHQLSLTPDHPDAHYNLSLVALARGDHAAGWKGYEWRWQGAESSRRHRRDFTQPQWRGENIAGQSILLHAEQGLGDTIQFIRYAALVAQRGARVIVECQPELVRLLRSLPGIAEVLPAGAALPAFDCHCPLMSLPLAFATTLDSIPATTPYLYPSAIDIGAWAERIGREPRRKVGLVWAGNAQRASSVLQRFDQRRSLLREQLAPLAQCASLAFFSLQLGQGTNAESSQVPPMRDLTADIRDFADTAALVANLDLVISVDTSVAHLAGALGKPVWLLSRHDACWRWMREREDSPWYPTMRIFRQQQPGDWRGVVENVAAELARLDAPPAG